MLGRADIIFPHRVVDPRLPALSCLGTVLYCAQRALETVPRRNSFDANIASKANRHSVGTDLVEEKIENLPLVVICLTSITNPRLEKSS